VGCAVIGGLYLRGSELWVTLTPFTGSQAVVDWIRHLNEQRLTLPWLNHLIPQMEIAPAPVGLAANPRAGRRRMLANSAPSLVK